jgi:hypothetical protein
MPEVRWRSVRLFNLKKSPEEIKNAGREARRWMEKYMGIYVSRKSSLSLLLLYFVNSLSMAPPKRGNFSFAKSLIIVMAS